MSTSTTTASHPERPERLIAVERGIELLDLTEAVAPLRRRPATRAELELVHSTAHLDLFESMSRSGGGAFDGETIASPGSWNTALAAAGLGLAAAEQLRAGVADAAFVAPRPPGHHALADQAMGFCLVNNVAITAAALAADGQRVAIVDWDVHHGNGTNDIFHDRADVLFASIHQSPLYPGTGPLHDTGSGVGEGFSLNLPVPPGSGERTFVSLIQHVVAPAARTFGPAIVLVSAGYDAHREDPLAQCSLDDGSYAALAAHVRELGRELGAPIGVVLEGGYALGPLARSTAATIEALAGDSAAPAVEPDAVTARAAEHLARWWPVTP